jgi:hypothetical protein
MTKKKNYDNLSIFDSLQDLQESKNIMHYQLYVDFTIDKDDFSTSMEVIDYVKEKASAIPNHYAFDLPDNLFGDDRYYSPEIKKKFQTALYQHCAISSLHTVKYLLYLDDSDTIKNATKKADYYNSYGTIFPGYFTIREACSQKISLTSSLDKFVPLDKASYCKKIKKVAKNKKAAPLHEILGTTNISSENIPFYNIDFYHWILDNHTFFSSMQKEQVLKKKINATRYKKLLNALDTIGTAPKISLTKKNDHLQKAVSVDNLLLNYQLERYFSVHLIPKVLQESEKIKYPNFDLLRKFFLLPNAFSRNLYVDWAFHSQTERNEKELTPNEWENHKKFYKRAVLSNYFNNSIDTTIDLVQKTDWNLDKVPFQTSVILDAQWTEVTELAITFLVNVYFPFYEKFFFIYLYEICKKITTSTEEEPLEKMCNLLFDYCSNNLICNEDVSDNEDIAIPFDRSNSTDTDNYKDFYLDTFLQIGTEPNYFRKHKRTYTLNYFSYPDNPFSENPRSGNTILYDRQIKYLKEMAIIQQHCR